MLLAHSPNNVEVITDNEWEETEMGVDNGASDTVVDPDMIPNIAIEDGDQKRRGTTYEIATGELIPNLGEKRFVGVTENEVMMRLIARVADVNNPLLSVRKMLQSGHLVVFVAPGATLRIRRPAR